MRKFEYRLTAHGTRTIAGRTKYCVCCSSWYCDVTKYGNTVACSMKCACAIDNSIQHVNSNKGKFDASPEVRQLIVSVYQQGLSLYKTKIELLTQGFDVTEGCITTVLHEAGVMRNEKQLKGARTPPKYKAVKTCEHCGEEFKQLFARHVFCDACVPKDDRGDWTHKIRGYGISKREFDEMLHIQDGKCAICVKPFNSYRDTHVDHNHVTGEVRGLLCNMCNNMLKPLENASFLANATVYLTSGKDYRRNK